MDQQVSLGVAAFLALLGAGLVISIAAERVRIPAAVLLVAAGTLAGTVWHLRPPFAFGPVLLFVFLPPLVYEAAWNIDLAVLRRAALRVAILAVPGTLLSAFVTAGALAGVGALPFGSALLFGAIVSATDPVAVVAVFRKAAVPSAVSTVVEAESLANDGVAVVLYGIALTLAAGGAVAWPAAVASGALQVVGGIVLGAACAVPVWLALRTTAEPAYEVAATVALAYVAYLLADHLRLSGIFATAAGAVMLRGLLRAVPHLTHRDDVDVFWNSSAFIANATVFLGTGLLIDVPRALHEPLLVGAAVAALAASRLVLVFVAARERAARITMFLAGMRGALPLALALALPADLPNRASLIDGVFAVVLVTLVVQGAPLEPVVKRLYGATPEA